MLAKAFFVLGAATPPAVSPLCLYSLPGDSWCPQRESNPQNLVSETSTYANSVTWANLDQLLALPSPGLSCYTVRMSAYGVDIKHPRIFQGSRILGLVVAAKLYRVHPGVMVLPMTHFLQVKV